MRRARRAAWLALLSVLILVTWSATASAATLQPPIATGLAGPLQLAVAPDGSVYVGQAFAGLLTQVGDPTPLAVVPDGEVAGVDVTPNGRLVYTSSQYDQDGVATATNLSMVKQNGTTTELADLLALEQRRNPDAVNSYGFQDLTPECSATLAELKASLPPDVAEQVPDPDPYTGIVDSHPYAVAALNDGRAVVADAAGNDLVLVNGSGQPKVLTVLPPQPLTVPTGAAEGLGLPECVEGATYNFEPVPTDVEVGPDGMLYVTTLPGGPEGPELGPRGSVYRVDPRSGAATRIATGFLTATNLAVAPDGTVYVAELYAGQVSKVVGGAPQPVVGVPLPAGLEYHDGKLFVSYDVFGNGSIATIEL